jgi:hypothetical protein|tara:strand:+ start:2863 stop:3318 length:456 start_codon:yes stop_codon:yes gene_type:complete
MDNKITIRPIIVEDYKKLTKWWEHYDGIQVPSSDLLPNGGLGGFAAEKDGRLIAAAYIYLTNSAMGYVDFLISDPDYKGRDRFEIITQLIERCSEYGVEQGCRIVWAMTTYKGVVSRCEKLGHTVLEEDYTVIYTHDKAYEKLMKRNKEIE